MIHVFLILILGPAYEEEKLQREWNTGREETAILKKKILKGKLECGGSVKECHFAVQYPFTTWAFKCGH